MHGINPSGGTSHLRSEFADDPDMREIVAFFVTDLTDRVSAIRAAVDTDDRARLRTLTHQLKGAAGGYGFPTIGIAAATVERELLGDEAQVSALHEKVNDLLQLCRAAMSPQNNPNTTS